MKDFILVANAYKDKDLEFTNQIITYIREKGGNAVGYSHIDFSEENVLPSTECIIVLGGDGSLIRVATKILKHNIPIIGFNFGTLGYLCEVEASSAFAAIDALFEENFELEERLLLTGYMNEGKEQRVALNDVVIHRSGDLSVLRLNVYVNGEFLSTYQSDGMIIATPTGSTAYNMSAGGPIVAPKAKMLLMTPINAHNLNGKSIVFEAEDVIEIELLARNEMKDEKAAISFDGDSVFELRVGERFTVSKAMNSVLICKLSKQSFLEILRKKMESLS